MDPNLTVFDNLMYAALLRLDNHDPVFLQQRVEQVLTEMGLEEAANVIVGTGQAATGTEDGGVQAGISGGQRVRQMCECIKVVECSPLLTAPCLPVVCSVVSLWALSC